MFVQYLCVCNKALTKDGCGCGTLFECKYVALFIFTFGSQSKADERHKRTRTETSQTTAEAEKPGGFLLHIPPVFL